MLLDGGVSLGAIAPTLMNCFGHGTKCTQNLFLWLVVPV